MRIRLHTQDADPDFVEERLGQVLYSHFRGLRQSTAFRAGAVARAFDLYEQGRSEGLSEPVLAGRGLLIMQRTLLVVEDLGSLLWALSGQDHWLRLTSYGPEDVDSVYRDLLSGSLDLAELWTMPTDQAIAEEPGRTDAQRIAALKLRHLVEAELWDQLEPVALFWLQCRVGIKTTMHGFSVLAAQFLRDPPGAGVLGEQFDLDRPRPYAASLVSTVDTEKQEVATTHHIIDLTPGSLASARDVAKRSCELIESLAGVWLHGVRMRHRFVMHSQPLESLTEAEQEAIAEFFKVDGA